MRFSHTLAVFVLSALRINGDSVKQAPSSLLVTEGEPLFINCTYDYSGSATLFWYVQRSHHEALQLLLTEYSGKENRGGFFAGHLRARKSFHLQKGASSLNDAAVFFCAMRDPYGSDKVTIGSGTRLLVLPYIEDSEPSVYKLKPRKGDNENLSACLITDYSPGNILAGLNGSLESVSSSFVITSYGASYGTVVWDDKAGNFSCSASHKGKTYSDLTEDADGPPVEEFETDERLNFISITVLGLRVIFLKSVAINLLLTFRLWSC